MPGAGDSPAEDVRKHYDAFLAECYPWIYGGREAQVAKNLLFFSDHSFTPRATRVAVDLGAGCGFQAVPLARLGYSVVAVDFCHALLDELRMQAGGLPVELLLRDIRDHASWAGRQPEVIVCMGDSLTHLASLQEAEDLVRRCFAELVPGGRLVLSLRDYSLLPAGSTDCIPVRRDADRIFLCSLQYHEATVTVEDIRYSRSSGRWIREAGRYPKIRISPDDLARMIRTAGFTTEFCSAGQGMITLIAGKGIGPDSS